MKIGFFVPCYIDAIYPQAAVSTYSLLQKLGLQVEFIERGACCGLPELDMGYEKHSCTLEQGVAPYVCDKGYDYVVVPSGICTDQFRYHFNELEQTPEVLHFRETVYDPVEFLHDVLKVKELPGKPRFPYRVAIHNGCHSLRYLKEARPSELMIKPFDKSAALLSLVEGIETGYATRRDECCGFGGVLNMGCSLFGAAGSRQGERLCSQWVQICNLAGYVVPHPSTDHCTQDRSGAQDVLYY